MNSTTKTLPAELREVPLPEWATRSWEWDEDIDGSWSRLVIKPIFACDVEIRAIQDWEPGTEVTTGEPYIGFGSLDYLYSDEEAAVWTEARNLSTSLLEAADLLEKAAKR